MKGKILYVSDRPSMGADMLMKNLGDTFEVLRARSSDEVNHVPEIVFVNLAGLESPEHLKRFSESKIFLLGTQAELDGSEIACSGKFVRPFNAKEVREHLLGLSQAPAEEQKTILLVDDDAVMIRTLREGLSTSYKVIPANSGVNALKILERTRPDLILLDYEMPEMTGPEVLATLRAKDGTKDIPVMFLTAKNDLGSISLIEALKPDGHMLKTLPLREIKGIIQKFFDGSIREKG
ncbi:MAG: response regulator [Synergistaceae bacterium]|nr:response regulator [Synergistaceae bacterium]